jgi:hypothetical protein
MKQKGRYYNTVEVIEAELQAVLNTLTEHNLQDAFTKMTEALGKCVHAEVLLRV